MGWLVCGPARNVVAKLIVPAELMAEIAQMIAADRSEPGTAFARLPIDLLRIEGAAMSELKLITPRRNFLVRALGFTAAGVTLPIGIVAADDPRARIAHHQAELEKAWRDYYGAAAVRTYADVRTPGAPYTSSWSAQVRATIPCGRWKATRGSASSQTPDLARSRHARRFTPGGFLFGPIVTSRFA